MGGCTAKSVTVVECDGVVVHVVVSNVKGAAISTGYLDVIHDERTVVTNVGVSRPMYIHNG